MAIEIAPIEREDIDAVAQFLHAKMSRKIPVDTWKRSFDYDWALERPNNGFRLMADGRLAGVLICYYSMRDVRGSKRRLCNLSTWNVLPEYRKHSLRLLMRALAQKGYDFVDHSASNDVVKISLRLKFKVLKRDEYFIPHFPVPWFSKIEVLEEAEALSASLSDADREVYRKHEKLRNISHLAIGEGETFCHIIYRIRKYKGFNCLGILHASDPTILENCMPSLGRYLLLRHGILFSYAECRYFSKRPLFSRRVASLMNKVYRSSDLDAQNFDNLYSELMLLPL